MSTPKSFEDYMILKDQQYSKASDISSERSEQAYLKELQIMEISNPNIPDRRTNNVNLIKIIWKLKSRTKLLDNILHTIINKWPEDKVSFLDIIERNKNKYQMNPPKEILALIQNDSIDYHNFISNHNLDIDLDQTLPSRISSSTKRSLR